MNFFATFAHFLAAASDIISEPGLDGVNELAAELVTNPRAASANPNPEAMEILFHMGIAEAHPTDENPFHMEASEWFAARVRGHVALAIELAGRRAA
ncbi:MAG: hypothetical protein RID81_07075 [Sandaracinaceae bacterium]